MQNRESEPTLRHSRGDNPGALSVVGEFRFEDQPYRFDLILCLRGVADTLMLVVDEDGVVHRETNQALYAHAEYLGDVALAQHAEEEEASA